jgi:undecaprenyl-diphosphatase
LIALASTAVFAVLTLAVLRQPELPADVTIARAVQDVDWGPVAPAFGAVDWLEGVRQFLAAVGLLVLVFLLNRAATWAALACMLSGAGYVLTELLIQRGRPAAGLVHVVRHTAGYSYPSGHAVFFTWALTILVLAVLRRLLPAPFVLAAAVAAVVVLALVCIGRVYDGEHWPSDVAGGLALGGAWTAATLSIRRLGDPVLIGAGHPQRT